MIGRRWVPPILWAIAILIVNSIPNPGQLTPQLFVGADKLAHLGMYGVLGLLLARALFESMTRALAAFTTVVVVATLGAADELHQSRVPGRSPELADWLADVSGATIGVLFIDAARRRRETST